MALVRLVERSIAGLSLASAKHPGVVMTLVVALTFASGMGLTKIEFTNDLVDILPEGNPNTNAAVNVSEKFPGHHSYTAVLFEVDPEKAREVAERELSTPMPGPSTVQYALQQQDPHRAVDPDITNITHEAYVRGMEEFCEYMKAKTPAGVDVYCLAYNTHVKLVNYTSANFRGTEPDESAFSMPGTDPQGAYQYRSAWETVWLSAPKEVQTQASLDWEKARGIYIFLPENPDDKLDYPAVGEFVNAFLDDYKTWVQEEGRFDVFKHDTLGYFDTKISVDAHTNAVTAEDVTKLAPLVAGFILVCLWFAFRSFKPLLIATSALTIGAVWTYGLMGWLGIPLNTMNLTIVPLILGVGIDYSIHVTNEFLHHKSEGMSDHDAFREAGRLSGFALLIATLTTALGFMVLVASPSKLMGQVGLLAAVGISAIFLLVMTYLPAAYALLGSDGMGHRFRQSRVMPALARLVGRHRGIAAALVVLLTVGGAVGATALKYESFGNPALNFPEGDPVREMQERTTRAFFGTDTPYESNWVTIQGDITDPAMHRYIAALQQELSQTHGVRSDSVTSVVNLVQQWVNIRDGTYAAPAYIAQNEASRGSGGELPDNYPDTQEELRATLEEMWASPFRTYPSLFINPEFDTTVILVDIEAGAEYEHTKEVWDTVWSVLESDEMKRLQPADSQIALGGYTAYSYLFITYEMPWVNYVGYAGFAIVLSLVALTTRSWRSTLAVGLIVGTTSIWWLGILPAMGIGLAVTLLIPVAFIMSIGSDYAVHMAWNLEQTRDPDQVHGTVGKAVLFSALTTMGAFALFVPVRNLMMASAMLATTVSIVVIFVATVLVIPILYPHNEEAAAVRASGDAVKIEVQEPPAR